MGGGGGYGERIADAADADCGNRAIQQTPPPLQATAGTVVVAVVLNGVYANVVRAVKERCTWTKRALSAFNNRRRQPLYTVRVRVGGRQVYAPRTFGPGITPGRDDGDDGSVRVILSLRRPPNHGDRRRDGDATGEIRISS